jgi:hypothetical protein
VEGGAGLTSAQAAPLLESTAVAAQPTSAAALQSVAPVAAPAAPVAASVPASGQAAAALSSLSAAQLGQLARTDPAAAMELFSRVSSAEQPGPNVALERLQRGHGPFSDPQAYDQLRTAIAQERQQSGILRETKSAVTPDVPRSLGGNVAAGMTTIEQLRGQSFIGRSPAAGGQADPASHFAPSTDPAKLPHTHRHAEQDLADKFHAAAKGLSPSDWQGQTLSIVVEAVPCGPCMTEVLPNLSRAYPGMLIEVKNLEGSRLLRYRDGVLLP